MLKLKIITTNNHKYFINVPKSELEDNQIATKNFIRRIKDSEFLKVNDSVYILSNHIVSVEIVL